MRYGLNKWVISTALLIACASGLSGCGRKGGLEAPSAYQTDGKTTDDAKKSSVDDKSFFLDPLL